MGMGDAVFSLARIGLAAGEDAGPPCRESVVSVPWRVGVLADRAQGRPREKSMA